MWGNGFSARRWSWELWLVMGVMSRLWTSLGKLRGVRRLLPQRVVLPIALARNSTRRATRFATRCVVNWKSQRAKWPMSVEQYPRNVWRRHGCRTPLELHAKASCVSDAAAGRHHHRQQRLDSQSWAMKSPGRSAHWRAPTCARKLPQNHSKWQSRSQTFTPSFGPHAMNYVAAWMPVSTRTTC